MPDPIPCEECDNEAVCVHFDVYATEWECPECGWRYGVMNEAIP